MITPLSQAAAARGLIPHRFSDVQLSLLTPIECLCGLRLHCTGTRRPRAVAYSAVALSGGPMVKKTLKFYCL